MKNLAENLKSEENMQTLSHSILVVDDCPEILALQKILLGSEGYKVFTAQSGEEALQILNEIEKPSLILLDMNLGDMTGIEFMNILEDKMPAILNKVPIAFLSGMNEIPGSKAIGFIRKPAGTDKLLAAVRDFIDCGHHPPYK